jgi:hypothetical protein
MMFKPYSEKRTPFLLERCFPRFRHLRCDGTNLSYPLGERDHAMGAKEMHRPLLLRGQSKKIKSPKRVDTNLTGVDRLPSVRVAAGTCHLRAATRPIPGHTQAPVRGRGGGPQGR